MTSGIFIHVVIASPFLLAGLFLAGKGIINLRRWWTMRGIDPTETVVESGLQEFEGSATAIDETATAPFSGAESLVCEYKVERYEYDDDGSNWDTVTEKTKTVPFEIEGGGPTVAVDPSAAQHLLTEELKVDTDKTDNPPQRVREYMDANTSDPIELGPLEIGGGGRYRFTERRLDAGEDVYVLGRAERDPTSAIRGSDARVTVDPDREGLLSKYVAAPFVVADAGEQTAESRQLVSGLGSIGFGLLFGGFGIVAVLAL